jgi:L-glyceraldehyde 3-phosphate reductase
MGIGYVDVFYHHRPDPQTPIEESMGALEQAVRQGKALYAAVSSYGPEDTRRAARILRESRTPFVLHQPRYSMFERKPEEGLFEVLEEEGIGAIVFSPLAQGLLTDRYLEGIPRDSRAARPTGFLQREQVTEERIAQARRLNAVAAARGQSLAQLAVAWVLRQPAVASALVGASRVEQLEANVAAIDRLALADDELREIQAVLAGG